MNITGKLKISSPSDDVIQFDRDYFPHPWSPEQWLDLDSSQYKLFTWYQSEKLIGFALFGISSFDNVAHLYKIIIHPSGRNKGEASLFWSSILIELKRLPLHLHTIYLEVRSANSPAIEFYKKCGFILLRRNKAYYSTGEDALIMTLML